MFEPFYGLTGNPFRMSADEQFRFVHKTYKKAWAYLKYALEKGEGFVLITGRPGTGKTTLIRDTIAELDSEQVKPLNIVSNQFQGEELLRLVALELGFQAQEFDKATLLTRIEEYALMLHREHKRVVVIVDEAQNLSPHGLEELRLLSNLQAGSQPLFQIVLIGQEEMRNLIYGQAMENITQRIVASCSLEPMPQDYVQGYVEHRLGIVGWHGDPQFSPAIYEPLHRITRGVPRDINLVMARLLLYGALEEKHRLNRADLVTVLKELAAEQRLASEQMAIIDALSAEADEETLADVPVAEASSANQDSAQDSAAEQTAEEELVEEPAVGSEAAANAIAETEAADKDEFLPESEREMPAFGPAETQWEQSSQNNQVSDDNAPTELWEGRDEVGSSVDETVETPTQFNTHESRDSDAFEPLYMHDLPEMHASHPEGDPRHQGLLTDVDELLGKREQEEPSDHNVWRWFFYPVAISLLVIAILVVRYPDDLGLFWKDLQQEVGRLVEDSREWSASQKQPTPDQSERKSPQEADHEDGAAAVENNAPKPESLTQHLPIATREKPVRIETEAKPEPKPASRPRSDTQSPPPYRLVIDQASGDLAEESKPLFTQLLQRLRADPATFVALTGVSGSQSGTLREMRDALKQAELVADILLQEGIAQERIGIEGRSVNGTGRPGTVEVRLKP